MSKFREDSRVDKGLKAQLERRRELIAAGARAIGWKVGFGAPAMLERLKLDAPLTGFLLESGLVRSDDTVSLAGWVKPVAEPEIAVHLGRDLAAGASEADVRAAIAAIGPAIELADLDPPPDDIEAALAGNIYQRHVVLGQKDTGRAGARLDGLTARVRRNGRQVAETADLEANTGRIIFIVGHVANVLAHFGEGLKAGEVVICGSVVPPFFLEATDTEIAYDLDPVGGVSVRFAR
jgi:2-keto-4-pentenoate hydratase